MVQIVGESGNTADVTEDKRLKTDTLLTVQSTLATQIYGWHYPTSTWQKINAEEYPPNSGQYWISVFGEVGTRTKAENPINISVRKVLATKNLTVFYDGTVPTGKIWYILSAEVADDLAAEFVVWEGIQRARDEFKSGDGSTKTFNTNYAIIDNPSYVTVKVGGVTKTYGSDYTIGINDDGTIGSVIFAIAPPAGTNNIEIIYDAVIRRSASFVQANSSFSHKFEAPLKLTEGKFIIGSVSNKSANAGTVVMNISGFYETA
jgi:hypothetical protein